MTGIEKTREEVIDVMYKVMAIERKASCRQVNCDILDRLTKIANELGGIDYDITNIIGD